LRLRHSDAAEFSVETPAVHRLLLTLAERPHFRAALLKRECALDSPNPSFPKEQLMMTKGRSGWLITLYLLASCCAGVGVCAFTGCERKEKMIDVESPGGDVEVERNKDTGKVEVEVEAPQAGREN
jgi:hypothetical protein